MAALQTITDVVSGTLKYEGSAVIGTPPSANAWTIKRTTVAGGVTTVDYPIGPGKSPTDYSTFSWDDRASYSYSLYPDNTPPTMASVSRTSDTVLSLTMSDLMLASSVTRSDDGGFVVADLTTPETTYAVTSIEPGITANIVTLNIEDASASMANGLKVTYSATGNGVAKDVAGNLMETDATGVELAEWEPPTMVSVVRNSDTELMVTLSELADAGTIQKNNDGGFLVYETGTSTEYVVSAIAVEGANRQHVVLTVADMAASSAVGVTVLYVKGGNGTVADLNGNQMATDFIGVSVSAWA